MSPSQRPLLAAILSLSLLTVMAGAAVAPALGVISAYFSDADPTIVQMIISVPALFIVLTSLAFPRLCRCLNSRQLAIGGLILYILGGCLPALFSALLPVIAARAVVGVGVGLLMPLSTGLLSYYFPPEQQYKLMGWSSAMNQLGGVISTLLAGLLAAVSWRAAFLVYLLGLLGLIPCLLFLPAEKLSAAPAPEAPAKDKEAAPAGGKRYVAAMFLLMVTFFIYPSSFAMTTAAAGVIPQRYVAVIMAGMDGVAFLGGLAFARLRSRLGAKARLAAPLLFLCGYGALLSGGWAGTLIGSAAIGFANGVGIPYLIATASRRAGRAAAATVLPQLTAALYLAQFCTPLLLSAARGIAGGVPYLSYGLALLAALCFTLYSLLGLRE